MNLDWQVERESRLEKSAPGRLLICQSRRPSNIEGYGSIREETLYGRSFAFMGSSNWEGQGRRSSKMVGGLL